ncbi:MAG TPA: hypothetical protein VGM19_11410 [Armatimonadota bacterium]|jgi:hypothetical protein
MKIDQVYGWIQALIYLAVVFVIGWGALLAAGGADRQLTLSVTLAALIILAWLGLSLGQMRSLYVLKSIQRRLDKLEKKSEE